MEISKNSDYAKDGPSAQFIVLEVVDRVPKVYFTFEMVCSYKVSSFYTIFQN
ncbi:MAG: hypothetical protein RMI45_07755 [Ignisphaera sp.]|nr:hypothetical protein [Ignisphaera sp.]MDW8086109.1 hypothetical protein [Ignisphaera sp.]